MRCCCLQCHRQRRQWQRQPPAEQVAGVVALAAAIRINPLCRWPADGIVIEVQM